MKSILNDYQERISSDDQSVHGQEPEHQLPSSLRFLLQARTADAVFVLDPEHCIVYWDGRAESLTGLLAEETIGKPCKEIFGDDECEGEAESTFPNEHHYYSAMSSAMRLAEAGHPSPGGYEMRIPTRWGSQRWVGVSSLSLQTDEGTYLIHLLRDTHAEHETLQMARALIAGGFSSSVDARREELSKEELSKEELSLGSHRGTHRDTYNRDIPELTPRQLEVLGMLASGKSAREICSELYLSQATVRNHIRALLLALGAHSQLEALAKARRAGLLVGGSLRPE
jgi:PAS domain S-box-containing protein